MNHQPQTESLVAKNFYPLIGWTLLIFISSSIEGASLPPLEIWSMDKLIHTVVYAVLAFFSLRAFVHYGEVKNKNRVWIMAWSLVYCIFYGASDEIHQRFVHGRDASVMDFFADSLGIVISHLYYYFRTFKK